MGLGVDKMRLTGGEPLLREISRRSSCSPRPIGLSDLAITDQRVLLAEHARGTKEAGPGGHREPRHFGRIASGATRRATRAGARGIAALARGLPGTKLDTVVMRGLNDDELVGSPRLRQDGRGLRFIEYMDVARERAGRWTTSCPGAEIVREIGAESLERWSPLPAERSAAR